MTLMLRYSEADDPLLLSFFTIHHYQQVVDESQNLMRPTKRIEMKPQSSDRLKKMYCGGNATDVERATGVDGDQILYIGVVKACPSRVGLANQIS